MSRVFVQHLEPVYGAAAALSVAERISGLVHQWQRRLPAPPRGRETLGLSQRDALLITYADQLRTPGQAPLKTLSQFCEARLQGLVSGVHLLPFYPSSSDDGFAVMDFQAVDPDCGAWEDIAGLGARFDLMFDGVFNHVSAQGKWFRGFLADDPRYRDFFITVEGDPDVSRVVRPRALPLLTGFSTVTGRKRVWTTFSADQADLNYRNPEVLLAVLETLLFYVSKGARFIRLDAVAFLWKEIGATCLHLPQTHALIRLLRAVLDAVAPQVLLVTETNVPHPENISYFGDGRTEAQLVYNFALPPLVLQAFQTGRAGTLTRWSQSLVFPSDHVTFFNFLASHDGIGLNPARGFLSPGEIEAMVRRASQHGGLVSCRSLPDGSSAPYELNINYLDALSNPAANESAEWAARRFITAQAILLSLRGVPGIYFHSLFGSRGDPGGAASSGLPRRINRQKLPRATLERELADPGSLRARVFSRFRELLRVRRDCAAFGPRGLQHTLSLHDGVFALVRTAPDGREQASCYHNLRAETLRISSVSGQPLDLGPFETIWLVNGSRIF
jgi:glucosylglycerate phosphorylase